MSSDENQFQEQEYLCENSKTQFIYPGPFFIFFMVQRYQVSIFIYSTLHQLQPVTSGVTCTSLPPYADSQGGLETCNSSLVLQLPLLVCL